MKYFLKIVFIIYHFFCPVKPKPVLKDYESYDYTDFDCQIDNLIADYRQANSLPLMGWPYGILADIAGSMAKYMAENKVIRHDFADERFEQLSLRFPGSKSGEILAANYDTPAATVRGWKISPKHNKSMLSDWDDTACASATDENGDIYVCVMFIKYKD